MKTGKVRGIRRVGIRYAAIALMTTTVLSVGIAGTASASTTTLTAVGSTFASAGGTGLTTASATLATAGDLLVIWVQAQSETTAGHVTGITGSGTGHIGTAVNAIQYITGSGHPGNEDEIWYAPVTTAGAITLTFAWSGSTTGEQEYSTQEFQPSAVSTYSVDYTGSLATIAASTTVTFPTLTPTMGAGELYAGYNSNNSSGSYGSPTPSGYTVEPGGTAGVTGDAVIFGPDTTSSAQSPAAVATTNTSTESAIGALIIATAGATATDAVHFNSEGGSAVSSMSGLNGSTITLPGAPTYAGYTFNGWFAAASGGSALPSTYTLAASPTNLYAQWTAASQSVTYNLGGGTGTLPTQANVPTGGTFTVYSGTNPTKAGYTFAGWSDGTNVYADGASYTMGASNVTLTAQWTATSQSVTYNLGGGTGITLPTQANVLTAGTFNVYSGTNPTKAGYTFAGWSDGTNVYADGASYTMGASNVTLTAQWTLNGGGGGGGGGGVTTATLVVTVPSLSVISGGTVTPSATVSGLATGDTATASGLIYTYAGTGTTTYAASTTAPTAVGTYSITPSGGTVTVSPSADQAKYAGTYTYVPGTLTITAVTSPPPPPVVFHAARVVGSVWSGRTVVVTIDGTGFYGQPRITSSTGRTTTARVTHDTGKVLTVRVTVKSGTALGTHTFTIILANGKKSVVRFVLR